MVKKKLNPHSRMTRHDAERAIYVDCEGFENSSPTLIGIQVGPELEQIVLDHMLEPVATSHGHRLSTFEEVGNEILNRSQAENRMIVAYSQHERNLFQKFADLDLSEQYRDARLIAKRWRSIKHPELRLRGRGLKDFLEIIEYKRGRHLGDRKATSRIRYVRDMLDRRGSYECLTPVAKAKWTKLLEHNRIDCDGMRELVLMCTGELENRNTR